MLSALQRSQPGAPRAAANHEALAFLRKQRLLLEQRAARDDRYKIFLERAREAQRQRLERQTPKPDRGNVLQRWLEWLRGAAAWLGKLLFHVAE